MPQFWDITPRTHDVTGKLRRTKTTQIKIKEHQIAQNNELKDKITNIKTALLKKS